MNINYSIENLRQDIYNIINNCNLPIGTVYFVFKDIFGDVAQAYQTAVKQEMQEQTLQMKQQLDNIKEDINFDEKE